MKSETLKKSPAVLLGVIFSLGLLSVPVQVQAGDDGGNYCSKTTKAAFKGCKSGARTELKIGQGKCINVIDNDQRSECYALIETEFDESREHCAAVKSARKEVCELVGEGRYDPFLDPALFVDPSEIGHSVAPNPYLPLIRGLVKVFESEDETVTVTVTDRTREIQGITAAVVSDVVEEDGELIEVTDDWFAQDIYGNVWYLGEHVLNYEDGVISDLGGSFEAGLDYARAGILVKAVPAIGDVYRQEFYLDEAEDLVEVIDLNASESVPAASCDRSCMQTMDWTPLEPDSSEYKFYLPGIGVILAYDIGEPENREALVEIIYPADR